MGFFKKLLGREHPAAPASSLEKVQISMLLLQQNQPATSVKCGKDGRMFLLPQMLISVTSPQIDTWVIDVGGYCDRCGELLCPRHLRFVKDPPDSQYRYVLACSEHGVPLSKAP
jgi:hypothetical protein